MNVAVTVVVNIWCLWRSVDCLFGAEQMICEKNWVQHRKNCAS